LRFSIIIVDLNVLKINNGFGLEIFFYGIFYNNC
jgi:hypothetical protein